MQNDKFCNTLYFDACTPIACKVEKLIRPYSRILLPHKKIDVLQNKQSLGEKQSLLAGT